MLKGHTNPVAKKNIENASMYKNEQTVKLAQDGTECVKAFQYLSRINTLNVAN